jgi:hypothetical protein
MFDVPELIFLVLVFAVLWWLLRQGRRLPQDRPHRAPRRAQGAPRKMDPGEAEDLVACGVCGAYVASGAPQCRRPDCPRPR